MLYLAIKFGHELCACVSVYDSSAFYRVGWAAGFGVEEGLIRVSVGMEGTDVLLRSFEVALAAAEAAVTASS